MFTWLTNLAGSLGNWMVSPWLFLAGAALLAGPIIIHLLNKRKFRTVDWAAIEFLLEAHKTNRRRIRLENLLLLLLRCLAVLLIALLLSRPFRPQTFAGGALQSVRFERVVVLDDSLSMRAVDRGRSAFDIAKQSITELLDGLKSADSDESFSLVRLSQPMRPVISGVQLNESTVGDLIQDVRGLEPSDVPVRLEESLLEVEKLLRVEPEYVNRVLYLVSDLRARDWNFGGPDEAQSARQTLIRVSQKTVGCYIVDVGADDATGNVVLTGVLPKERVLVAGVSSPFEVTIANKGPTEVRNLQLSFAAGESLPLTEVVESIPSLASKTLPLSFTFAGPSVADPESLVGESNLQPEHIPVRVSVHAADQSAGDRLLDDNQRLFAARVDRGIRTLIVDGDPSAAYAQAETFSLQRALAPPGETPSGLAINVVTDVEFDSVKLSEYHVIFLCNLYRLTDQRRTALENWVASGGGLVIYPGDQVDEYVYNETLYRDGAGLLPGKLTAVFGDEKEEKWVTFEVGSPGHPALNVLAGENNPFSSWVKVFRWWGVSVDEGQRTSGDVLVSARFSDPENSPAVVEKAFGQGRIVLVATAVDRDWNNWPLDPSYVIFTQELTRYVVDKTNRDGTLTVGQSIQHPLDLTEYQLDVGLRHPNEETTPLEPRRDDSPSDGAADETQWIVDYDKVDARGFYELNLLRANGTPERTLFAANVDSTEGDLRRADLVKLRRHVQGSPIELVQANELTATAAPGAEGELWPLILCIAVTALCGEQALGWILGRRR